MLGRTVLYTIKDYCKGSKKAQISQIEIEERRSMFQTPYNKAHLLILSYDSQGSCHFFKQVDLWQV